MLKTFILYRIEDKMILKYNIIFDRAKPSISSSNIHFTPHFIAALNLSEGGKNFTVIVVINAEGIYTKDERTLIADIPKI